MAECAGASAGPIGTEGAIAAGRSSGAAFAGSEFEPRANAPGDAAEAAAARAGGREAPDRGASGPRGSEPGPPPGGIAAGAAWRRLLFTWAIRVGVWVALLGSFGGGAIALGVAKSVPDVSQLREGYDPPQTSRIFTADGELLSTMFDERRTVIDFEEIPTVTKLAFLAAEDAHFYEHGGIRYPAVLRALWANVRNGRTAQGGSTITQQVGEIVLLGRSRAYLQKLRELFLAWKLERELTKDEILGLYLNHAYLGHGRHGVEEAALYYFGKKARALNLPESAVLAGILSSPGRYSPRVSPERALSRRAYVLDQMLEKGFIGASAHAAAMASPLRLASPPVAQSSLSPEVVALARKEIRRRERAEGHRGGYTVRTTLDSRLQALGRQAIRETLDEYAERHRLTPPFMESRVRLWGKRFRGTPRRHHIYVGTVEAVDDARSAIRVQVGDLLGEVQLAREKRYNPHGLRPSEFTAPGALLRVRVAHEAPAEGLPQLRLELGPQAALVAIDPRNRDVLALVGSYEGLPGELDRARRARRQPGSAFKPFVYSAAFHTRQWTAATVLPLEWPGHGLEEAEPPYSLDLRRALAHSNNEAAQLLLRQVGPERVVDWARQIGIRSRLGKDLSLALGAYEVRPIELANAYATFASGGFWQEPRLLVEVGRGGERSSAKARAEPWRVMTSAEAYLITSMLQSVVEEGTAQSLQAIGVPVAAKTGTTNQSKDAWLVGYSTELCVAVWVGYDDALPLGAGESGSRTAAPAFARFMRAAHQGHPATRFARPAGIVTELIDPETGLLAWPGQEDAVEEEFLAGTQPLEVAPAAFVEFETGWDFGRSWWRDLFR